MEAQLTYFKDNGKYYSSAEMEVNGGLALYEIWEQIDVLRRIGRLPGLIEHLGQESQFLVHIEVPDHPNAHPVILGLRK